MIIDAEVHLIQPNRFNKASIKKYEERAMRYYIYDHPDGEMALKLAQCERLLESMNCSGIDKSVIMGLPWQTSFLCRENNKYISECCKKYPKKFYGFGLINLSDKKFSLNELKRIKSDYGFYGVKVIASWQNSSLAFSDFYDFINEIIKLDLILLPHIDFMFTGSTTESPHHLYTLAKTFPELKILAPHLGGLLCLHQLHPPIKKILKNVRFITSVSTTIKFVEFAAQCVEPNQLVFGTDYPFQPNHDQNTILRQFNKLKISNELKKRIFSENINEFFS